MNQQLPFKSGKNSLLEDFSNFGVKKTLLSHYHDFFNGTIKSLSILFLCLVSVSVFAQTRHITGKITDPKDGSPVFGASILATGGGVKSGTQTASDGTFSLDIPNGATRLIVTSIGYEKQEINIGSKTEINISLVSNQQDLNGIVVIGYGSVKKKDLTGTIATIQSKDFNQGSIATVSQLLQNKVAGLEIGSNSGSPGAGTTIKIRGNTSLAVGNTPLIVIDGTILDGGTASPGLPNDPFTGAPANDPLVFINPNDIASIDVLKDASATAIFGSRGSNGVIIYTTKKGSSGSPRLDFNAKFSLNAGVMKNFESLDPTQFRAALRKYGKLDTGDFGGNVNALKEISQNKLSKDYNIAFSGGSELGRFRASFLASDQNGYVRKTSLEKYIGNLSGEYKFIDKRLTLDFNLIVTNTVENYGPTATQSGSQGNIFSSVLNWNPTLPLKTKGAYNNFNGGGLNSEINGFGNPLAFSDSYFDIANTTNFLGHFSTGFKILPNLEYKFFFGGQHANGTRDANILGWLTTISAVNGTGYAEISHSNLNTQNITHTLTYSAKLASKLSFEGLAGYEYYKRDGGGDDIFEFGFNTNLTLDNTIPQLYTANIQNATSKNPLVTFVAPTSEIQSVFGRINFNLSDKYYLTGTARYDGSNKFGSKNKYGLFPSVALKWILNNENFLKNNKFFSNLSIRASWGITGNQDFPAGLSQNQTGLPAYNTASPIVYGNPNLQWQEDNQANVGLDFSILNGKISGNIDYYKKTTSKLLYPTTVIQPGPSARIYDNLDANIINSGVELALTASLINGSKFGFDLNGNFSYNHNIVKNLNNPATGLPIVIPTGVLNGAGTSATQSEAVASNQPVDVYYLKHFSGFDSKGFQKISDNPGFAGDPNPHTNIGLGTVLRYNHLSFNMNWGASFGFLIYNNTDNSVLNIGNITAKPAGNISVKTFNSSESIKDNAAASDRFLESGNFVKLRNATLTYDFGSPGKYIKNLKIFANGSNLLVITKFSGFDPEVNVDKAQGGFSSRSIEYIPYPTIRTISFGIGFSL